MPAVLYAIPASHPCAAAGRALELKGIPYRRVELIPVAHRVPQWLRFHATTVPGIEFEDGARVVGSRAIVRALDQRVAVPALVPAAPERRARVERAEEWGDQVLQPLVRRVLWAAVRRAPATVMRYSEGAELPVPAAVARASAPMIARVAAWANGAGDADVRADLAHLGTHLDRVDGWIADGTLDGEAPNAGDLQIASGLRLLLTVGDVAPRFDARPAGALARRWFPQYPGATPVGVLPADWVA
jgi:glutathione S-transferase